jgi:hypothetical protein
MIQAVADDEERGALGMHYTSVPNIRKVLDPLFLDDLRAKLEESGDGKTPGSARKLLNLRNRLARIRVFDPACGSGNFLVIAYKEMRQIEAIINERRGERDLKSAIPISNFRGIELRHFPAEIARLALVIAQFQSDVIHRSELLARNEFLPLNKENWIVCGNALRLDWLTVCPPTGTGVKIESDGLFKEKLDQVEIDFENAGGETYICGNPPYKGGTEQTAEQKADLGAVFADRTSSWKSLDYVSGWFLKFADYAASTRSACAFVSTNSIAQGEQVARLWPLIFQRGLGIIFAHTSFKWSNLASHNAGVTVVIVGLGTKSGKAVLFENSNHATPSRREVDNICPYLVPHDNVFVSPLSEASADVPEIVNGNKPADGGHLIFDHHEVESVLRSDSRAAPFIRRFVGAADSIQGGQRFCLWISDDQVSHASGIRAIAERIERVRAFRAVSSKELTIRGAATPHAFQQLRQTGDEVPIVIPRHSSVSRSHLPISLFPKGTIIADGAFAIYDAELWSFALLASRLHLVWIAAVCGKIKTDYRYSSTIGWNTFPVPTLTDQNKADLTRCAEDILLAREAHFPATIAEMYDPEAMDTKYPDLRAAHERNDETLERIYIGRRFRNDTERLEKLFELYTEMTAKEGKGMPKPAGRKKKA